MSHSQVENPGGTDRERRSASGAGGDFLCAPGGNLLVQPLDKIMVADLASSAEVESLLVNEGGLCQQGKCHFQNDTENRWMNLIPALQGCHG